MYVNGKEEIVENGDDGGWSQDSVKAGGILFEGNDAKNTSIETLTV